MRNLTNNTSLEDIIYDLRNEDNKEDLALWLENNVEEKAINMHTTKDMTMVMIMAMKRLCKKQKKSMMI